MPEILENQKKGNENSYDFLIPVDENDFGNIIISETENK
jgi:hypothetical protein